MSTGAPMATRLSFFQESLLSLLPVRPDLASFSVCAAYEMCEPASLGNLTRAACQVLGAHPILRARFLAGVCGDVAGFADPVPPTLLTAESHNASAETALEVLRRPFQVYGGGLFRVTVLRMAGPGVVVLLSAHRLVADRRSLDLFMKELERALLDPEDRHEAPAPPYCAEFFEHEQSLSRMYGLDDPVESIEHWRSLLESQPLTLDFPLDSPRPSARTCKAAGCASRLEALVTERLEAYCAGCGQSAESVLATVFAVLMARYSRQDRFCLGLRVHPDIGTTPALGPLENIVPLPLGIDIDLTFQRLAHVMSGTIRASRATAFLPFGRLVAHFGQHGNRSVTPIVQFTFAYNTAAPWCTVDAPRNISPVPVSQVASDMDLDLRCVHGPDGISLELTYSTDIFEECTGKALLRQFEVLLLHGVSAPNEPASTLPLATGKDIRELYRQLNPSPRAYPVETTLHAWFEETAAQHPQRTAVSCGGAALAYRELNHRAGRLAAELRLRGVAGGDYVGLYAERGINMVVALLGILKAGAAYVPLEPAYPAERIRFILDDCSCSAVVSDTSMAPALDGLTLAPVILVDALSDGDDAPPDPLPPERRDPNNTAYIIYTSGSTGRPKGVMVSHANVVRLFLATRAWFNFTHEDVWSLFHSIAFDFSVWEVWGALLYGGRLVVVPHDVSRSPRDFHALLVEQGVTVLNQTPSAFQQLTQFEASLGDGRPALSMLRLVIFGGEALRFTDLAPWYQMHDDRAPQLVNMYGITETTVHVTYRPIRAEDAQSGSGSAIGVPIPDLQLHILDENLRPLPAGVPGELHVGGAGLARGYLNRPELTAQRFIDNPRNPEVSPRLYRTGDLVRLTPDGALHYMGRIDNQVKIRGFRIELGEIASVFRQHAEVADAAVLTYEPVVGDLRLAAYLVPGGEPPSVDDLRSFLKTHLPEYMVPSKYVFVESLPLTANGKLDHRRLPLPLADDTPECDYLAPESPVEVALAEIWAELLGLDRVGANDDFFALGGHSILAIRLVSRVEAMYQVRLPVSAVFEAPTLAALALLVEEAVLDDIEAMEEDVTG